MTRFVSRWWLAVVPLLGFIGLIVVNVCLYEKDTFWDVRFFEIISFIGTTALGAILAFLVSKSLATAAVVEQHVSSKLNELNEGSVQLQDAWSEHLRAPSEVTFDSWRSLLGSFGRKVAELVDTDVVDLEGVRDAWFGVRDAMNVDSFTQTQAPDVDGVEDRSVTRAFSNFRRSTFLASIGRRS